MATQNDILHVGDTVLWQGSPVQVESITLIEDAMHGGTEVPAVPWMAKELFRVTLNNKKWAYGAQIKPST